MTWLGDMIWSYQWYIVIRWSSSSVGLHCAYVNIFICGSVGICTPFILFRHNYGYCSMVWCDVEPRVLSRWVQEHIQGFLWLNSFSTLSSIRFWWLAIFRSSPTLLGDKVSGPAWQSELHIHGPYKLQIPMRLFSVTCKVFCNIDIFRGQSYTACI